MERILVSECGTLTVVGVQESPRDIFRPVRAPFLPSSNILDRDDTGLVGATILGCHCGLYLREKFGR